MPIRPRSEMPTVRADAGDDTDSFIAPPDRKRTWRDRGGDRPDVDRPRQSKRLKAQDAQDARDIIKVRRRIEARALATQIADGETPKGVTQETGPIRFVDANSIPDGKLVKLSDMEQLEYDEDSLLEISKRWGKRGGIAAASLGYLGYETTELSAKSSLVVVDWTARKLDRWSDKLLAWSLKQLPWPLRPMLKATGEAMDKTAKWIGLDTTLFDHLKKNREDRRKLAAKLLKDLRAEEKKHEAKVDAKKKKEENKLEKERKRFERLVAKGYTTEEARMLVYEMDEIEAEEEDEVDTTTDTDTTPTAAAA